MADNGIDLKSEAPGIYEKMFDLLDTLFPKKQGRWILGVECFVDRDLEVKELSYDPAVGVVSLKAKLTYSTSDEAVINQAGLGISFPFGLETKYDLVANDLTKFKIIFDLPKQWGSVDVDIAIIKRVLEGDLAAALEVIPNFGLVKRKSSSEYDEQKKWYEDKYGGAKNVYFASSDFVRWASPETAGRWALTLISSGGSATTAIASEAKAKARKELAHIITWLQRLSVNDAPAIAANFVNGQSLSIPQVKLFWQRVTYKSQVVIAGRALPEIAIDHGAFVLVWQTNPATAVTFNPSHAELKDDNDARPKWQLGARYVIGPSGCRVIFTHPDGAAAKANLKIDDLITKVGDVPVGDAGGQDLLVAQIKQTDSQIVNLEVVSAGQTKSVSVTLDPAL